MPTKTPRTDRVASARSQLALATRAVETRLAGIKGSPFESSDDRRRAVERAMALAEPGLRQIALETMRAYRQAVSDNAAELAAARRAVAAQAQSFDYAQLAYRQSEIAAQLARATGGGPLGSGSPLQLATQLRADFLAAGDSHGLKALRGAVGAMLDRAPVTERALAARLRSQLAADQASEQALPPELLAEESELRRIAPGLRSQVLWAQVTVVPGAPTPGPGALGEGGSPWRQSVLAEGQAVAQTDAQRMGKLLATATRARGPFDAGEYPSASVLERAESDRQTEAEEREAERDFLAGVRAQMRQGWADAS